MGSDPERREATPEAESWSYLTNYEDQSLTVVVFKRGAVAEIKQASVPEPARLATASSARVNHELPGSSVSARGAHAQRSAEIKEYFVLIRLSILVGLALLSACAETMPVQPASSSKSKFEGAVFTGETVTLDSPTPGEESYRLYQQAATGFVSMASVS